VWGSGQRPQIDDLEPESLSSRLKLSKLGLGFLVLGKTGCCQISLPGPTSTSVPCFGSFSIAWTTAGHARELQCSQAGIGWLLFFLQYNVSKVACVIIPWSVGAMPVVEIKMNDLTRTDSVIRKVSYGSKRRRRVPVGEFHALHDPTEQLWSLHLLGFLFVSFCTEARAPRPDSVNWERRHYNKYSFIRGCTWS